MIRNYIYLLEKLKNYNLYSSLCKFWYSESYSPFWIFIFTILFVFVSIYQFLLFAFILLSTFIHLLLNWNIYNSLIFQIFHDLKLNNSYLFFTILMVMYIMSIKNSLQYVKYYILNKNMRRKLGLNFITIGFFVLIINFWITFDQVWPGYQNLSGINNVLNVIQIHFGIDGISLCFVTLTALIFAILFLYLTFDSTVSLKYVIICLIIEFFLLLSFYTINLLLFYVFFESILIPMFIMIIYWGSSQRKIKASIYFFLYTLIGSILLLFAILYIYNILGTLNYQNFKFKFLSNNEEILLWMAFFLPFAIKVPMFPFHLWLPEAHVEAPTIGSIILASLLLKLGGYGFLRFTIPLFPYANEYFLPLLYMFGITGIINASLTAVRQIDIKRIIAYSSIAHMNLVVLGIFSNNEYGFDGSIYLMIGHGIVSAALFFLIGIIYDRYHTRLIYYYGGLVQIMPKFTIFFIIFSFANMGFPGTVNFIGEFLILIGILKLNFFCGIFASLSTVFSAIYSIYLFNRINFGTLKVYVQYTNLFDITFIEFVFLFILALLTIVLGLNGDFLLQPIQISYQNIYYNIIAK